jgi:hypothetical protein
MGPTPKKLLPCEICKSSFPSYRSTCKDHLSHRTHRAKNERCRQEQARLRSLHLENNGNYDLNFDVASDEELSKEVEDDDDFDVDGRSDKDGSDGNHEIIESAKITEDMSESAKVDEDISGFEQLEADDIDDLNQEDEDDEHSMADSEDSYDRRRRLENQEYKSKLQEDKEGEEETIELNFRVAEAKRDPKDVRYWTNPQEELIGKRVKKRFSNFGVYTGIVQSWERPYFKVYYPADQDSEEMTLKDVLYWLDTDFLHAQKANDEELSSGEDEELEFERSGDVQIDEDVDSEADSKHSSNDDPWPVTVLTREECEMENNDILKIQEVLLSQLYDQRSSPIKFNKVNEGKQVNKIAALQILQYAEEHHMSRTEADEYLKWCHNLIETVTGKPFDMVTSYKTLKRVFLESTDRKIPLSKCEIRLPKQFFEHIRTKHNKPLPTLKASYIPLEVAIGTLLLKMSPVDIVHLKTTLIYLNYTNNYVNNTYKH